MARDEFLERVRDAASQAAPRDNGGEAREGVSEERLRRHVNDWLTPHAVEGFDPADFPELSAAKRKALETAVAEFRKSLPPAANGAAPSREQVTRSWSRFEAVANHVRELVREEWLRTAPAVVDAAEGWCRKQDWAVKQQAKPVEDRFLGEYTVPQLLFHTGRHRFMLDPLTRYASGASGRFDLAVLPGYDSATVARYNDKWFIYPVRGEGRRRVWAERAFLDTVTALSAFA